MVNGALKKKHSGVSQTGRPPNPNSTPPKPPGTILDRVLGFPKKKIKHVLALKMSESSLIDTAKYNSRCNLLFFSLVWHQALTASTLWHKTNDELRLCWWRSSEGNLFFILHRDKAESTPKLDYHQSIQLYIFLSWDEKGFAGIKHDCKAPQNTSGQPIH